MRSSDWSSDVCSSDLASKSGRHPRKSPAQVTSQCNHFLRGVLRNAQYRRDLHVRELTPKSLIDSNRGILLTTVQVQRSDRVDLEEVGARDFSMLPKDRTRVEEGKSESEREQPG